jgi:cellulose synthase/poly-beta-1,6-N-acetylglucosamine synthase-like glycosyltransferase
MAESCFFLAILFFLTSTHPFVSYPLSLVVSRVFFKDKRNACINSAASKFRYAICVCAYNEEKVIEAKARNLIDLRQIFPELEIYIYIDDATDQTAQLLEPFSNDLTILNSNKRHGKTYGMNQLVAMTTADILIFTDANVMVDINSMQNLHHYFNDERIGCVSAHLKYLNANESSTAQAGSLYWRFEEMLKRLENSSGGAIGADGALFAIRRSLHVPPADDLIDDFFVSMQVILKGFKIIQASDINVYERSASVSKEEFFRKIRIGCQGFNVHRALWPAISSLNWFTIYKYMSHKVLRWICGINFCCGYLLLILSLIFFGQYSLAFIIIIMSIGFYVLGGVYQIGLAAKVWELFYSIIATGLGVWKSLRGERYQTWVPPKSARAKI